MFLQIKSVMFIRFICALLKSNQPFKKYSLYIISWNDLLKCPHAVISHYETFAESFTKREQMDKYTPQCDAACAPI